MATKTEQMRAKYARHQSSARNRDPKLDPDEFDALLEATYSQDARERADAARELCPCHLRDNIPAVWDRVLELARDPDLRVRKTVLHMMTDGSPREREADVIAAIETMFHDPDPKMRRVVRRLLAAYRRTGKINVG